MIISNIVDQLIFNPKPTSVLRIQIH